jgi:anti-sigma regulatory factor (Ser/Thr protein kinase)
VSHNAPELFHLQVPCTVDAPFTVRSAVERCQALRPVREEVKLIASELVTNAVIHSGCEPDDMLDVLASVRDDRFVIAVGDPGLSGATARLRIEDDPVCGGFGLRVVQELADRWGAERPNGQRVWAEVALPPTS